MYDPLTTLHHRPRGAFSPARTSCGWSSGCADGGGGGDGSIFTEGSTGSTGTADDFNVDINVTVDVEVASNPFCS